MHLIQKNTLEVILPRPDQSQALTRRIETLYEGEVLPALEGLFDKLAPDGREIHIDQMSIEVVLEEGLSDRDFCQQMVAAFAEGLKQQISHHPSKDAEESLEVSESIESDHPHMWFDAFIQFIEEGYFPWWMADLDFHEFENKLLQHFQSDVLDYLSSHYQRLTIRQRFLWQFSSSFAQALSREGLKPKEYQIWQHPIAKNHPERFRQKVWDWICMKPPLQAEIGIEDYIESHFSEHRPQVKAEKVTPGRKEEENSGLPKTEPLYMNKAGLVLLAPYLPFLFDHFQWLEERRFVNDTVRMRAVHLIEYLASGKEGIPESNLLMAKWLCGVPLAAPILRELVLTQEEKHQADELLDTLIHRWPKMHNSNHYTLRTVFLQRAGKRYRQENAWHLQVESHTLDVLLQFLPWSISMVHLPWLEEMIWVEWG